jgi:hypothetical protein
MNDHLSTLEAAFDAASTELKAARAAWVRSASHKNATRFLFAETAFQEALDAWKAGQDAAEAAECQTAQDAALAARQALADHEPELPL